MLAPAVIGIFWGAPLIAREFEAGTFRLAWTQSVTRTRWLAIKLALTGLAAMAVTEALSLIQAWWAAPISQAARLATRQRHSRSAWAPFSPLAFDAHGITPLGYAAFAFTLGVTAGVLIRRTIPAMALTLAIFAVIQVAMPLWIRPHLFPPDHTTAALSSFTALQTQIGLNGTFAFGRQFLPSQPGAWILSSRSRQRCRAAGQHQPGCLQVLGTFRQSRLDAVPDQPRHPDRPSPTSPPAATGPSSGTETAIYLALALALAGYCFWQLSRRRS